ncbi:oligosaccharide flippase family protein [Granulicella sp. WH15]|uniref:oligosaccharide flippase family protein n=1 Tax=Granulicella sp. WH15 TaxID=2602070 RepID=UPI0013675543|nr:oligosaccharide flippase family protein [Granulicella sp. WH15]QHN04984.1 oligosaccharide flippase family protein [Granulicella sp. WH15]
MKRHLTNALHGVLDYASYPLGMIVVAPIVLRRLGAAEYGLWMVATAVVSAGGILASGFSDAGIQRVAGLRGADRPNQIAHTVRTLLAINLILGSVVALATWLASPYMARHLAVSHTVPLSECLASLHIASVMILIRAIEAVSVSTQRAFEAYRGTVQISTAIRILTLASAALLATLRMKTESIMLATAVLFTIGTCLQFLHLRKFIDISSLWPSFQPQETHALLGSGIFLWLQTLGSILFRQLDRILLGISLGAAAVAPYSLAIQFAEPLFGLTASGLGFFFPYLSSRASTSSPAALRGTVFKAFLCNLLLVSCGAALLLLFGNSFLRIWAGPTVAHSATSILPLVIAGSALSGLSVTGTYAMQALGLFRIVAYISLGSRSGLLLLMLYMLHHHGLHGLAITRICYGAASLLVYLPLMRQLAPTPTTMTSMPIAPELQEGPSR